MFTLTSQKLTRAAIVAGILAGAVTFITASANPQWRCASMGLPTA